MNTVSVIFFLYFRPAVILPSPGQYTIAVRCCPILFELHTDGPEPVIDLPYRMVIAIATRSSIVLYDTQQITPFAVISNIHYTRLTDITWSLDGRILAVSSTDGFCSIVIFEKNELGTQYVKEDSDEENLEVNFCDSNKILIEEKIEEKKEKKNNFLKQWATKQNIQNKNLETDLKPDTDVMKEKSTNIIVIDESPKKQDLITNSPTVKKKVPITISKEKKHSYKLTDQEQEISSNSPTNKNTSIAKPIAVRRKPRDQMDITKFLKSPGEPPFKKLTVDKNNEKINFEVKITDDKKDDSFKKIINTGTSELLKMEVGEKLVESIVIEDSQDMTLVLEDSNFVEEKHCNNLKSFEEYNKKVNNDIRDNKQPTKITSTEECHIIDKQIRGKKELESILMEVDSNPKESSENSKEIQLNSDTEKKNENYSKTSSDVNIKINEMQIQTPTRKKVPFITLSSPKSKKKES